MLKIHSNTFQLNRETIDQPNKLLNYMLTNNTESSINSDMLRLGSHIPFKHTRYTMTDLQKYRAVKDFLTLLYCIMYKDSIVNARSVIYAFLNDKSDFSSSLQNVLPEKLDYSRINSNSQYVIGQNIERLIKNAPQTKTYNNDANDFISLVVNNNRCTYETTSSTQRDFDSYQHSKRPMYYIPLSHISVFVSEFAFYANRDYKNFNKSMPRKGKPFSYESYSRILANVYKYFFEESYTYIEKSFTQAERPYIDESCKNIFESAKLMDCIDQLSDKKSFHPSFCKIIQFFLIDDSFHFTKFLTAKHYYNKYASADFLDQLYIFLQTRLSDIIEYKNTLPHDIIDTALTPELLSSNYLLPDPLYIYDSILYDESQWHSLFIEKYSSYKYVEYTKKKARSANNESYRITPIVRPGDDVISDPFYPYDIDSYKLLFNDILEKAKNSAYQPPYYNIFNLLRDCLPNVYQKLLSLDENNLSKLFTICFMELKENRFFRFIVEQFKDLPNIFVDDNIAEFIFQKLAPILPIYH